MIFVVTSIISYKAIRNQFLKLNHSESVSFLIYDYSDNIDYTTCENIEGLVFKIGVELDNYLLRTASQFDLLINFDGFHVFSKSVTDLFDGRSANFHPSLLPSYGGINPISWGLLNGEVTWGYSWHRLSKDIDRGTLLHQEQFLLPANVTQFQVMTLCIMGGLRNLEKVIFTLLNPFRTSVSSPTVFIPSYFCGNDCPQIQITSLSELRKYEKIIPFNPRRGWRWQINLAGFIATAVSSSSNFGSIHLRKKYVLEGLTIYYAD